MQSDTPTQSRPRVPRIRRYREMIATVKEATLLAASVTWLACGVAVLIGVVRIIQKMG